MIGYVKTDDNGRVSAWTGKEEFAIGFEKAELPSDFFEHLIDDWKYIDGKFEFDGEATKVREEYEQAQSLKAASLEEVQTQLDALAGNAGEGVELGLDVGQ